MKLYRYSDSTLKGMKKDELIKYVRMCERNQDIAEENLERQYENIKDWQPVVHSKWEISCDGYYPYCRKCKTEPESGKMTNYCPNCGAKMDLEE